MLDRASRERDDLTALDATKSAATQRANHQTLLVSFSRFGALIGVSRHTVRRMADEGTLRAVLVRRRRLIPVSELRRLIGEPGDAKEATGV